MTGGFETWPPCVDLKWLLSKAHNNCAFKWDRVVLAVGRGALPGKIAVA